MARIIYAILGIIEFLVGLRFLFRLIGVNPGTPAVSLVYRWSEPFVAPFAGILGQPAAPVLAVPGQVVAGVFETGTLIALLVYALVGAVLARLLLPHRS